ncbi:DUF4905 domain-containing protein [Pontibacter sp. MBLB2868]|uniref:DUF4905 domain-containing protein n=1 Tax=Pontibacter sp. MBLB2868 TaxID=3451555 RepID=UPI003F75667C
MWRIRIDTADEFLALEVRDADLLIATFYTLNTNSFALSKLSVQPSKGWWMGLEDAQFGMVFLHGYGDRKIGQHKGITALAAVGGEVQWEQPEYTFYGILQDGILAYPAEKPEGEFKVLQPKTGQFLNTGIQQQEASYQRETYSYDRYAACIYPAVYLEGEEYFEQVRDFLNAQHSIIPVRAIEYAETPFGFVLSYYENNESAGLTNFVAAFTLDGDLQLKAKLGSGLSGIGSDTFFIFNLNLYFLQDKHILKVYRLLA